MSKITVNVIWSNTKRDFYFDVYVTGNKRNQGFHVIPKQFRDYV